MRGLALDDLSVARRRGAIVSVMAMWDQSAYKQDVVHRYGSTLRRLRPVYDVAARVIGGQPLPAPGEAIRSTFAALVCVQDDDPRIMRALLEATAERACQRGHAFLTIGLADDDPLLAVARRSLHITYRSDLFLLTWGGGEPLAGLDGRVPYVEIATL